MSRLLHSPEENAARLAEVRVRSDLGHGPGRPPSDQIVPAGVQEAIAEGVRLRRQFDDALEFLVGALHVRVGGQMRQVRQTQVGGVAVRRHEPVDHGQVRGCFFSKVLQVAQSELETLDGCVLVVLLLVDVLYFLVHVFYLK